MTVTYTTDGGLVGVSFLSAAEGGSGGLDGGFGGAEGLPTFGLTFLARLTSSLILDTGSGNPTWSRATKAWGFNEIGYLEELASGCAFFGGARLVRNLVSTPSNTLAISGTKTVTLTQPATLQFSMGAGSGTATFSGTGGATGTLAAGASRVSVNKSITAGTFIVTASVAALSDLSIVDITGYDSSYVPEYVSVGVVSTPYHGAGIDGAKYYETSWQGAPIAAVNLLGFRRESAATNNLLYCRDLSTAEWATKTNITATKTAIGLDGLANTATILTATATDAIILQPITLASAARCASAYVKRRTGTGTVSFTQDGGSSWTNITSLINSSTWSRVQITATLANPSVGFKIGTSGDSIDVDCVHNEAGVIATSPILTTTAAVTRNADIVTYQVASNVDFAQGTFYCEVQSESLGSTVRALTMGDSFTGLATGTNPSWRANDGTTTALKSTELSSIQTVHRKRGVSWGGAGLTVTGEGMTPVTVAFDGAFGSGGTLNLGVELNGYIRNTAFYNYQFSDAELQAITS